MNSFEVDEILLSDLLLEEVVNNMCEVVAIGTVLEIQMDRTIYVLINLHVDQIFLL